MAWVPQVVAISTAVKAISGLFGRGDDKRLEQMRQQFEAQIAQIRSETAGKVEKAREEAVKEYKDYLIQRREKYPRPPYLPDDNVPTIGVMGESGVGKSTFINTVLGKKVAKTGVDEQTMDPALYDWGGVRLVDLPGGCTVKFKAEDYFQMFGIRYFDTIVILNSDARVKQLGTDAVDHLTRNGIPTMFVLSKIEGVVKGEASANDVSEEEVLEEMDRVFTARLAKHNCPVYLISAVEVKQECGSLAAVPDRKMPLQRRINKDWIPLLQNMRAHAIDRNQFVSENR